MKIDDQLQPAALAPALEKFWRLSGDKLDLIHRDYDPARGAPVFTVAGKYTARGWTEWTEGFLYGSDLLQFDATGYTTHATRGTQYTIERMASHVSHTGVHDHGFNNLSTYGNWLRLQREGKLPADHVGFCELALKVSGAVQAARWSRINHDGHSGGGPGLRPVLHSLGEGGSLGEAGYIYSFNGPHSLFVDTIRSVRIVMVAHALGHRLMGENDAAHSLLERGLQHIDATAKYSIYYGEGRDSYDEPGRTAHESIFNPNDGRYRCPNSQQGFSGFTTWTRGLAWAMVGFAEELEFLDTLPKAELTPFGGKAKLRAMMLKAARATCDWYIANTALDGIPYWDGGAPNLGQLGDWRARPAEPFNDHEPVDSSAAAIGVQGLLRLGRYLGENTADGKKYWQAGLTALRTLLTDTYLGIAPKHQGLLLHSVYHRPNGWDHIPAGRKVPCGEACLWGDYHLREAALYLQRIIRGEKYYTFFGCLR